MHEQTDQELIHRYLHGDKRSFDILVARYLKLTFSIALRYTRNTTDAEDVTQEVFVRVWKNLKKFDLKKDFKPWLGRIATNTSIDFLRKKKTMPFSQIESEAAKDFLADTIVDPALPASEALALREAEQNLAMAVNQLPAAEQKIFTLRQDDELSFREIADRLAEPLNTVKSRYRRTLLFLRKLITRQS